MSSEPFQIVYDGPALADGKMDVADLGPALIALGEVVARTNQILNGDRATVTVRINASSKPGSFPSLLELYQQTKALIPDGEIKTGLDILAVLGMAAAENPQGVIGGVVDLWLKLRGENPKVVSENHENRTATIEADGENYTVNQTVLNVYGDQVIRQHFYPIVSPLNRDGVDEIRTEHSGVVSARIAKNQAPVFLPDRWREEAPQEAVEIWDERTQAIAVEIISSHTLPGYKWRFISRLYGLFTAHMLDTEFLERYHRGDVKLSGTDWLEVELRTTTTRAGDLEHQVLKVTRVIKAPEQQSLAP